MSGGSCLAVAVHVLEKQTGQPVIQASAQFLRAPAVGTDAVMSIRELNQGRSISQVSAVMEQDGAESMRVLATLGSRPSTGDHDWPDRPDVPAPDACHRLPFVVEHEGDLHTHLDIRLALDPPNDPRRRMAFWVRAPEGAVPSAFLTLIADYLPEALNRTAGRRLGAISLDNSIRITRPTTTEWLLCVTQIGAIENGLFHGRMTISDERGQTLAFGEQSGVVRVLDKA
jgi:acyl-CoA thioesterase II